MMSFRFKRPHQFCLSFLKLILEPFLLSYYHFVILLYFHWSSTYIRWITCLSCKATRCHRFQALLRDQTLLLRVMILFDVIICVEVIHGCIRPWLLHLRFQSSKRWVMLRIRWHSFSLANCKLRGLKEGGHLNNCTFDCCTAWFKLYSCLYWTVYHS